MVPLRPGAPQPNPANFPVTGDPAVNHISAPRSHRLAFIDGVFQHKARTSLRLKFTARLKTSSAQQISFTNDQPRSLWGARRKEERQRGIEEDLANTAGARGTARRTKLKISTETLYMLPTFVKIELLW